MSVEDLNPQYENKQYEFRQMRDTIDGVSSVKRSGSLYLPIPTAMLFAAGSQPPMSVSSDNNDLKSDVFNIVSNAPWRHDNPAYSAYVQRARFPDMTALLLTGLTGIAIKKKPEIELPSNIAYLEESATKDGKTLIELFRFCVNEILSVGRISLGLEVDPSTSRFFINTYSAESFINWKTAFSGMDKSNEVAALAVFQESSGKSEDDEFSHDCDLCQLVMRDGGFIQGDDPAADPQFQFAYNVQRYADGAPDGPPIFPTVRGNTIPFTPLVCINSDEVSFDVGNCPLIGVSDIAISIYQKDADMSNAEFLTCNPMLVTTGISDAIDENGCAVGGTNFPIGSAVTLNLPDTESNAFYVEPKANCLQHMINRIENLKEEAVQYGAAVLSSEKSGAEAADTVKMRQSGNSSTLREIITSVGEGITQILQYAYMWDQNSTSESDEIEFEPNLELIEASISPQEMTALLQSFMNKGISHESYLKNMKKGGVKLEGETIEEEIALIDTSAPELLA